MVSRKVIYQTRNPKINYAITNLKRLKMPFHGQMDKKPSKYIYAVTLTSAKKK